MSSSQKTLSYLSWQLLSELDELKHDQFAWLMKARQQLLGNWENSRTQYRSWRQKVDTLIENLNQKGDSEGANWLAQTLLRDPTIANPGEFELTIPTPHGTEVIHIRGCPNEPSTTLSEQPSSVPGLGSSEGQPPSTTSAAVTGPGGFNTVSKKKRGKAQKSSLQSSDAPPEAITEAQATTNARSSGGEPKKAVKPAPVTRPTRHTSVKRTSQRASVQKPAGRASAQKTTGRPSAQKTTGRASSELKKKGPGRPANFAETDEIDPECRYWAWTVKRLRKEARNREVVISHMNKAEMIISLIQNDKGPDYEDGGDEDAEDDNAEIHSADTTSLDSEDATTGHEDTGEAPGKTAKDRRAQSTCDQVVDAAEDGSTEVPQPDKLIVFRPETAHHDEAEGHGPSTTDGSQAMLDASSTVLSEVSGNQEVVPEVENT